MRELGPLLFPDEHFKREDVTMGKQKLVINNEVLVYQVPRRIKEAPCFTDIEQI